MNETFKEITSFFLIIAFFLVVIFGTLGLTVWSDDNARKHKHQQQQELKECYQKTNDLDWCFEKVLR